MRGLLTLTVAAVIAAAAPPAQARELSTAAAAAGPILVPGNALWSDDGDRLLIRPDAADVPLPPPGPVPAPPPYDELEVRGAHADALAHADGVLAIRRGIYACWRAQPWELTTSCNSYNEVLAGPLKGPFVRVSEPHACRRFQAPGTLAVAAGRVVVAEAGVECRGDLEPQDSLVAIDPRDPSRRRIVAAGKGLAVRGAGDLVAWTTHRRRTIVVFDLARNVLVRTLRARDAWFGVWDVQADGTVVAGLLGRGESGGDLRPVVYEPGLPPRSLPGRIGPHVRIARDRVAAPWPKRFAVVDLRGRSRRSGRERPTGAFDFDGRRATWVRVRVLSGPSPCPSDPGPGSSSCRDEPFRADVSLRLAVVAR